MEKRPLEECLRQGMSLEAIGELTGKHPSTVSYWLKKHGLQAGGGKVHAPKGPIDRRQLVDLVEEEISLREIAERLGRSETVIRYWIARYEIPPQRSPPAGDSRWLQERADGVPKTRLTEFVLEGRGSYRCVRCRVEAVARRRRRVKRTLVEEAGGRCVICGYSRCQQALQFHHLNPATKRFQLGQSGHSRSLARARAEAGKCVLLCATCHAEVEAGITEMPLNSCLDADPG